MDNMIDIAKRYLDVGFSVIPLYSNDVVKKYFFEKFKVERQEILERKKQKGIEVNKELLDTIHKELLIFYAKRALVPWRQYQEKPPSHDEVEYWFNEWPEANIGIVTGKVSNIFVLDIDGETGESYIEQQGGVPETVTALTGKGRHLYFAYPDGIDVQNGADPELKLDIRANGGYVVAPPSIHGSKRKYVWDEGKSIFDLKPSVASEWVIDFAAKNKVTSKKKKTQIQKTDKIVTVTTAVPVSGVSPKNKIFKIIQNGCEEGGRSDSATRVIGHWLRTSMSNDEVWEVVTMWNSRNNPPLEEDQLREIFESITASENSKNKIFDLTKFRSTTSCLVNGFKDEGHRIPFGRDKLCELEKRMGGGLVGGNFYLLGGVPSAGKTALCNNIADNLCLNGTPVIIFSFDDGVRELNYRTIARFAKIDIEDLNQGRLVGNMQQNIQNNENLEAICSLKYIIDENYVVEDWQPIIEQVTIAHGQKPVIIVDYLKKVKSKKRTQDERTRMDAIINAITFLAKNNDIPIIVISELNREAYRPGYVLNMSAFKETGALEYEASWLGIMAPVETGTDGQWKIAANWNNAVTSGNISLSILKTKRGTGKKGNVNLALETKSMTFSSETNLAFLNQPRKKSSGYSS